MDTLRIALVPLLLLTMTSAMHANESESGLIDIYSSQSQGRPTASGELYNPTDLTAAHATLPFGARVRVANFETGKMVDVRINDRKARDGRLLRLSHAAGNQLGIPQNRAARGSLLVVAAAPMTAVHRAPAPAPPTGYVPGNPGVAPGYSLPPKVEEKRGLFQKKKAHYENAPAQYQPYGQPNSAPASKEGIFGGLFNGKQSQPVNAHDYAQNTTVASGGSHQVIPMSSSSAPPQAANGSIPQPGNTPPPVAYRPSVPAPVAQAPAVAASSAPYRVQFGAFRRATNAQELSGMLSRAGVGTSVVRSNVSDLNLVVSSGGFRTAEEAQQWIDYEGARRGWTDRPVVIR